MSNPRVTPDDFVPPTPKGAGRPQRPDLVLAMQNPGRWVECELPNKSAESTIRAVISNRRHRKGEKWKVTISTRLGKYWLRYEGKADD